MDDLRGKLEKLNQLVKALLGKPAQAAIVPTPKMPKPKRLSMPNIQPTKPTKIPGVAPSTKKDPAKVAEQLKNPRPTKPKIEILKTAENGQWTLE